MDPLQLKVYRCKSIFGITSNAALPLNALYFQQQIVVLVDPANVDNLYFLEINLFSLVKRVYICGLTNIN